MDMQQTGAQKCACPHHKMKGGLVVLFGLLFLLRAFGMVSEAVVMYGWPILVLLAGIKMLMPRCGCCKSCQ